MGEEAYRGKAGGGEEKQGSHCLWLMQEVKIKDDDSDKYYSVVVERFSVCFEVDLLSLDVYDILEWLVKELSDDVYRFRFCKWKQKTKRWTFLGSSRFWVGDQEFCYIWNT